MNIWKKSVAAIISVSVLAVSTALLLVLAVLIERISADRWWKQLHSEEEILADSLAESLALPLWNFDGEQIDKIMKSAMQNKNIFGIAITSADKFGRVYAKTRDAEWRTVDTDSAVFQNGMLIQERDILFANEKIGRVKIAATTKFTELFLRNTRVLIVSIILPFDLILVACLYFALRRWVVQPLRRVEAFAVAVSSGGEEDLNVSAVPFYGELESVRSSITKMVDLLRTRYQNVQRALELRRESEERFQKVYDSINDAIFIHDMETGAILDANRRMCEMYGLTREEALKSDIGTLSAGERPYTQSDALDKIAKAAAGEPQLYEWRAKHKDGRLFWVEVNMRKAAIAGVDRIIVVVRDITERKRAEEAQRLSQAQLMASLENTPNVAVQWYDETGRILYWNRASEEFYGWKSAEAIGRTLDQLIYTPEDAAEFLRILAVVGKTGKPFGPYETRMRRKDGTEGWILSTAFSIPIGDGRLGFVCMDVDITGLKRTEEDVRLSEKKLSLILENAPLAVYVLSHEGKGLYINKPAEILSGYNKDALLRMHFLDLVHPEDRGPLLKRRSDRLAGKPSESRYIVRIVDRSGSVHWVENQVIVLPWEGTSATFNFLQDITERKQAEEELEKLLSDVRAALDAVTLSRKEWQETFDSITDLISIHDLDFNIVKVNKAFTQFMGLPYEQIIGRKCFELLHPGTAAPVPGCPHARTLTSGKVETEDQYNAVTGRTLHISTYPYYGPDGSLIGSIHISRDITDEKEREVRMIMAERLASLGQMASGIAHEINNPLESVMICAEMLLMKVSQDKYDRAQFEKYLKIIDEEVLRCRDITGSMLAFSRQTAEEQQDVDVHLLLDKAIDLVGYQGRLKNVQVIKRYGDRGTVRGNEGELRQVFLVFIINALDAMENRGTLTIETRAEGSAVWIKITDTGHGIPPENMQKIFQPFFTTKTATGGTGLGLPIAHRIITNHRGRIEVSSGPGPGAAFTITLPR